MRRITNARHSIAVIACLAALGGCVGTKKPADATTAAAAAVATAADIDRLTGAPWEGTLTYLDYTSHARTTIRSSLQVVRLDPQPDGAAAWEVRVGYADEPHADSGETATLTPDGRVFRGEQVVERSALPDGTLRVVTEQDGEDDNRSARFRFVYLLGDRECSLQKLVRFAPQDEFFERHIYRWRR